MGKFTINGPFSIAMLNYQRVYEWLVCWLGIDGEYRWGRHSLRIIGSWMSWMDGRTCRKAWIEPSNIAFCRSSWRKIWMLERLEPYAIL
jgi:hypothetical protein